jgi:hypothetical protein
MSAIRHTQGIEKLFHLNMTFSYSTSRMLANRVTVAQEWLEGPVDLRSSQRGG